MIVWNDWSISIYIAFLVSLFVCVYIVRSISFSKILYCNPAGNQSIMFHLDRKNLFVPSLLDNGAELSFRC